MEKTVLFTNEVQIKKFENENQLFIDSTFRFHPKDYYQVFIILADIGGGKIIFPIFHILMSNKSAYSYYTIFNHINNLIDKLKIQFSFNNCHIMIDFEHGLRDTLKKLYPKCILEGCFFHFSKALWTKSKKLGLINKKNIDITSIINMSFKNIPF